MKRILAAFSVVLSLVAAVANAGQLAGVSVINQDSGERLKVWRHQGRNYIAGTPGERYGVEIRNKSGGRLLSVVSIDGINVISGATASTQQQGYVIDGWQTLEIEGWRKSMDEVAAFNFTRLPDSYAARTGRARQVGVIGVALFQEEIPPVVIADAQAEAAAAPTASARRQSSAADETKLGTGHGERLPSASRLTDFQRATPQPAETIVIYYDTLARLQARGIVPRPRPVVQEPHAFPGNFVPDPS